MTKKTLSEALSVLRNGDLLLFRQESVISRLGRGKHSHAALFAWWNDEPFCVEVLQGVGGRAVHLAPLVQKYPGQYEIFQADPDARWGNFDREGTVRAMCRLTGCHYGYHSVLRTAILHLPLIRLLVPAETDDSTHSESARPFCSQAVTMACRLGGNVDPVPQLADRCTEPSDLARSPFFRFWGALIPDSPLESEERILFE